jgi:flavodoxin
MWQTLYVVGSSHNTHMLHNENMSQSRYWRDKNGRKEIKKKMKAFLIYDSLYGNTEKIAQAISDGLTGEVQVVRVGEVNPSELKTCDLLILGSPTHGGFPTEGIYGLLKASLDLAGVNVAAFDTRTKTTIFGYAATKIAKGLQRNGGKLLAQPEGFVLLGIHGPLKDGELERATKWAQQLPLAKETPATNAR